MLAAPHVQYVKSAMAVGYVPGFGRCSSLCARLLRVLALPLNGDSGGVTGAPGDHLRLTPFR